MIILNNLLFILTFELTLIGSPQIDGGGGRRFGKLCYTSRSGRRAFDIMLC